MVQIKFYDLQIGTVSGSSGIFHGSNRQWKYKHTSKKNQAFGAVNGEQCFIADFHASLDDGDQIDFHSIITPHKM